MLDKYQGKGYWDRKGLFCIGTLSASSFVSVSDGGERLVSAIRRSFTLFLIGDFDAFKA